MCGAPAASPGHILSLNAMCNDFWILAESWIINLGTFHPLAFVVLRDLLPF